MTEKNTEKMTKQGINDSAQKTVKKKKLLRLLKILAIIILILLIDAYIVLWYWYHDRSFTVYLENEDPIAFNVVMYDNSTTKRTQKYLKSETFKDFSTTSIDWLPGDLNEVAEGSHNGNNYIAYTFYVANQGHRTTSYTAEIKMQDVIRNVDEALRVMVYRNGQRTVYAKSSPETGEAEPGTVAFRDEETVMLETRGGFAVGNVDKYTVVIFIEGTDKECTDALIGGEFELDMYIREAELPKEPYPEIEKTEYELELERREKEQQEADA